MNKSYNKSTVFDIQIVATSLFLITVLTSIVLLYNQKLLEEKKPPLFSKELNLKLAILNRTFILVLVFTFILAGGLNIELDKDNPKQLKYDYLEILGSILTLVVSLISIYLSIKAFEEHNLSTDIITEDFI